MEKWLKRCLESIKKQTFIEFEAILVDDGSEDKSQEICKEFLVDTRFKYIEQKNQGVSVARNVGLEMSSGKWISFVDPDDYLQPEFLHVLAEYCDFEDVDVISCCCKTVDCSVNQLCHFFDGNQHFCDEENVDLENLYDFAKGKRKLELYI